MATQSPLELNCEEEKPVISSSFDEGSASRQRFSSGLESHSGRIIEHVDHIGGYRFGRYGHGGDL